MKERVPISELRSGSVQSSFDLTGRVAIITGGAGLLGVQHAQAISEMGGTPVLVDIDNDRLKREVEKFTSCGASASAVAADVTDAAAVTALLSEVLDRFGRVDVLINNAANDPKVQPSNSAPYLSRMEEFPLDV